MEVAVPILRRERLDILSRRNLVVYTIRTRAIRGHCRDGATAAGLGRIGTHTFRHTYVHGWMRSERQSQYSSA